MLINSQLFLFDKHDRSLVLKQIFEKVNITILIILQSSIKFLVSVCHCCWIKKTDDASCLTALLELNVTFESTIKIIWKICRLKWTPETFEEEK